MVELSFLFGLIPMSAFLAYYGLKTTWYATRIGVVMFFMALTTTVSYCVTLATILFPGFFLGDTGENIRVVVRFALGSVSWGLLGLLVDAQLNGRNKEK